MNIYNIIIDNRVVYVGQANNIRQRYRQHKWLLVHNKHQNKYLQEQYNIHKEFRLVIVKPNARGRDEQLEILKQPTKQRNNRAAPSIEELRVIHNKTFNN